MKKIRQVIILFVLLQSTLLVAQNFPYGFNYQAVARDANGNAKTNQNFGVRLTIRKTSTSGTIVWQEVHSTVTTNSMGQFNLVVGTGVRQGSSTVALFKDIDWINDTYFMESEIQQGIAPYASIANTQLLSVPYAIASAQSDTANYALKVADEQFAVYEERYAYNSTVSAIPINAWTGNAVQSYIPLTEQTASNTPSISYNSGLITLAPGTYLIKANTNNEVDLSPNGVLTMKSRIINSSLTMIAEGTTDYWYYGPAASGDAGKTLKSSIDQVITVTGTSTTIKFQRFVARGGTGSYLSAGVDGFKIPNEAVVLSNLYIKKIK